MTPKIDGVMDRTYSKIKSGCTRPIQKTGYHRSVLHLSFIEFTRC